MRGLRSLLVGAICATALVLHIDPVLAATDDLAQLYAQVLKNPGNSEINLRYAWLAEAQGKKRWALAAYERILLNDPNNDEARRGLERIQRGLVPVDTRYTVELGAVFESNPRYVNSGARGELQAFGTMQMVDVRQFGDQFWRTKGVLAGIAHQHEGDLNYGYAGAITGPMFDFLAGTSLHLGVGGGVSAFDHHLYYKEALGAATVLTQIDSVFQSLEVRYGYRDYDDFFPTRHGSFVDAKAKFAFKDIFATPALLLATPWARWSDIAGTSTTALLTEIQPGAYSEWGGRLELIAPVAEGVFVGPTAVLYDRYYRTDIVAGTNGHRHDTIYGPGFLIWIPNAIGFQTGVKIEYQYLRDNSNDPLRTFNDHQVMGSVVSRF
ncbi:MAG: tetratricopeptide repeat protein [Xanthobacteraceae bacterium]